MGKKLKQVIKISKNAIPVAKKAMPAISTVVNSMNLLENASTIVKPIAEDIREKNSERAKRIDAIQMKKDDQIVIKIEKANVFACAVDEASAFNLFLKKLNDLREKKIISNDIKIQREQIVLIEKLKRIVDSGGAIKDYIYRIEIEDKVAEKVERIGIEEAEVKTVKKPQIKFSRPLKRKHFFNKNK